MSRFKLVVRGRVRRLCFELYRRTEERSRYRVSSRFLDGDTVYWLSVWTPRHSLRVFPASMKWSDGEKVGA